MFICLEFVFGSLCVAFLLIWIFLKYYTRLNPTVMHCFLWEKKCRNREMFTLCLCIKWVIIFKWIIWWFSGGASGCNDLITLPFHLRRASCVLMNQRQVQLVLSPAQSSFNITLLLSFTWLGSGCRFCHKLRQLCKVKVYWLKNS